MFNKKLVGTLAVVAAAAAFAPAAGAAIPDHPEPQGYSWGASQPSLTVRAEAQDAQARIGGKMHLEDVSLGVTSNPPSAPADASGEKAPQRGTQVNGFVYEQIEW